MISTSFKHEKKRANTQSTTQTSNKICACVKEKVKFHDGKNDAFEVTVSEREREGERSKSNQKKNLCARIRPVGSYFVIDSFSQIDKNFDMLLLIIAMNGGLST